MMAPGATVGRYVVKRKLAEGGMAEIFVAAAQGPEGFSKDVVLKVVRSFLASDPQFIEMFIAEARLASKLNHANVVQIFDFGKHEDSYYLAMEYVRGASLWVLRQRCKAQALRITPLLVAEIGAQVARGLHYAHSLVDRGTPLAIVHRDVTPHNVLLSFDGAVKLTDFGIAKASTTHTAPGMLKGKFAYMAPEQARGEVVDARADLFALGIVMWEFLTGTRLFDLPNEVHTLRAVQDQLIVPPHRLNPDVPEALSAIVMRALERTTAARWPNAFELERALAMFVLSTAKTPEDASVARFVQAVLAEEYASTVRSGTVTELPISEVVRRPAPAADALAMGSTLLFDRASQGALKPTEPLPGVAVKREPAASVRGSSAATEPLEGYRVTRAARGTEPLPRRPDTARHRQATPVEPPRAPTEPLPPRGPRPVEALPDVHTDPESRDPTPLMVPAIPAPPAGARLATYEVEAPEPEAQPRSSARLWAVIVVGLAITLGGGWVVLRDPAEPEAPVAEAPPPPRAQKAGPVVPEPAGPTPAALPFVPEYTEPPARAVDAGATTEAGATLVPRPAATPAHVESEARGVLVINARPFASVYLNGTKVKDVEAVGRIPLRAGTWKVGLWHPRLSRDFTVTVKAGETVTLDFDAMAAPPPPP